MICGVILGRIWDARGMILEVQVGPDRLHLLNQPGRRLVQYRIGQSGLHHLLPPGNRRLAVGPHLFSIGFAGLGRRAISAAIKIEEHSPPRDPRGGKE